MEILDFIIENRLILIPVLYILEEFIKKMKIINNRWIPMIILGMGIIFSIIMGGDKIINNIIQGILVAGTTVFSKQLLHGLVRSDKNEM